MSVAKLDNKITIAMSVRDRHASAQWYSDMLGFPLRFHNDEAGWSEMQTNTDGVTLGLGEQTEPAPGNAIPVFGVADLDEARAAMEQADVKFDGPTVEIEGMVKLATFYDPDNNALMLAQDLAG